MTKHVSKQDVTQGPLNWSRFADTSVADDDARSTPAVTVDSCMRHANSIQCLGRKRFLTHFEGHVQNASGLMIFCA